MHTNNVNHIAQDNVAVLLFWRHKIVTPEGKTRRKKDNLTNSLQMSGKTPSLAR